MNIEFNRKNLLRILCLFVLIVAISMGAIELVFLVDLGGIDFAVTFLMVYFATIRDTLIYKFRIVKSELDRTLIYLSELYLFKPRVFASHATASSVLILISGSVLFACLMWLPAIYLSSAYLG